MPKKEKKVYSIVWGFQTEEHFSYRVLLTESESKNFSSFLQQHVDSEYLAWFEIREEDPPFSRNDFIRILKENFPTRPRDWMPREEE